MSEPNENIADIKLARSSRSDTAFVMIMIDKDHLKAINDNYGHQIGDDVLVIVANSQREVCRSLAFCGCWGEFLITFRQTDFEGGGGYI